MPFLRIDLIRGHAASDTRAIADAIHDAVVEVMGIPERDRFQIVTEHPAEAVIAQDAGLGFTRTSDLVMIQVTTQRGRTSETKQALYAAIARNLGGLGIRGNDIFIGYVENGPSDWSFGFGEAQYLTGALTPHGAPKA